MDGSVKVNHYDFTGISYEKAYLNGCKKLAKVMLNPHLTINVEKLDLEQTNNVPVVRFTIYTNIDMGAIQREYCKICKEFHCSFYINEEYNCARCNLKAYLKRLKHASNISKGFEKRKIEER